MPLVPLLYASGIDVVLAVRGQARLGKGASGDDAGFDDAQDDMDATLGACEMYRLSSASPAGDVCSSMARHLSEQ